MLQQLASTPLLNPEEAPENVLCILIQTDAEYSEMSVYCKYSDYSSTDTTEANSAKYHSVSDT